MGLHAAEIDQLANRSVNAFPLTRVERVRDPWKICLVNIEKVFDRDGWRCKNCRVRSPRYLRGTSDLRAPELDHIIPLALGGDHDYDNVQLLCRKCNGAKGKLEESDDLFSKEVQ
jgi:HNH endonuclease